MIVPSMIYGDSLGLPQTAVNCRRLSGSPNGEESYEDIAISVSKALGFGGKTMSWLAEDAMAELCDWARFVIASNSRVRAVHARTLLGWEPVEELLMDWIHDHVK